MAWEPDLKPSISQGVVVRQHEDGNWRLGIPPGGGAHYRLAQLDDTSGRSRRNFIWNPPLALNITARVSSPGVSGTWGFGLWNDPFSFSLGLGGGTRRFPALPNAAWFFYGSPPNYLSFQDDMPAQGFLAQVFRSESLPPVVLAAGGLCLPLLAWPWLARKLRPAFKHFIRDQSYALDLDLCQWHSYTLTWQDGGVSFGVDGVRVFETPLSPRSPLGLVIWIDNQYAAFTPNGTVSYGLLPSSEPAWMEISTLGLNQL